MGTHSQKSHTSTSSCENLQPHCDSELIIRATMVAPKHHHHHPCCEDGTRWVEEQQCRYRHWRCVTTFTLYYLFLHFLSRHRLHMFFIIGSRPRLPILYYHFSYWLITSFFFFFFLGQQFIYRCTLIQSGLVNEVYLKKKRCLARVREEALARGRVVLV